METGGVSANQIPTLVAPEDALSIHGLSHAYGASSVLSDVSCRVRRGSFTALLGPNGAGKTTLFSLCLRLLAAPGGAILIGGHDLAKESGKALAHVGVVYQEPTLDLDLTVRQNLQYFAALRGMSRKDANVKILSELGATGLEAVLDQRARRLSSGQRRRVEILRAMLHEPSLLLLDEATIGLDIPSRKTIVKQVHALARLKGVSVLWATHIIDEIEPDDDVIVLNQGRVIAQGGARSLMAQVGVDTLQAAYEVMTAATLAEAAA